MARKAQRGDHQAFMDLAHRYQNVIYRLAYRFSGSAEDALDLSQACIVKAWTNIARYDAGRPFKPWLMRLCANQCITFARQSRARKLAAIPLMEDAVEASVAFEAEIIDRDERRKCLEAVQDLAPDLRLAVVMRFSLGKSLREISEETGVKLPTIASRISRALELLRQCMQVNEVSSR